MKKRLFSAVAFLCLLSGVQAQITSPIEPLHIGDVVPDLVIKNIINFNRPQAKLSDYRGQLIILDFWATWCGPCVRNMPKLDSLRALFAGQLQVFAISAEKKDKVREFLKRASQSGNRLPITFEDTLLSKYFPARVIPQTVILDADRKVIAITNPDYITPAILQKAIAKEKVYLPLKQDNMAFKRNKPLLIDGNGGGPDKMLYRSMITRSLDGLSGSAGQVRLDSSLRGFAYRNVTLTNLYLFALNQPMHKRFSRLVLENVKDSSRYYIDPNEGDDRIMEWGRKNSFCYELLSEAPLSETAFNKIMYEDLQRVFGIQYGLSAKMDMRTVKCYVLSVKNEQLLPKTSDTNYVTAAFMAKEQYMVRAVTMPQLVDFLETQVYIPMVDETGYAGRINMDMDFPLLVNARKTGDLSALVTFLRQHGFELTEEKRNIEVLVMKEN